MRVLYHEGTLSSIFNGKEKLDTYQNANLHTSNLLVSDILLEKYKIALEGNQLFMDWFSSLSLYSSIKKVNSSKLSEVMSKSNCSNFDEYALASYYSDQKVVTTLSGSPFWSGNEIVNVFFKDILSSHPNKNNPYISMVLEKNGNQGFYFLKKYIKVEKEIYIYDQYINNKSKHLIDFIFENRASDSYVKIFLYKEDGNCFSADYLNEYYDSSNFKFYKINSSTAASIHDRFINFGRRLQLCFSVGLDQFNPYLIRNDLRFDNRESTILFYDIMDSDKSYEIEADNGFKISLPKRY